MKINFKGETNWIEKVRKGQKWKGQGRKGNKLKQ